MISMGLGGEFINISLTGCDYYFGLYAGFSWLGSNQSLLTCLFGLSPSSIFPPSYLISYLSLPAIFCLSYMNRCSSSSSSILACFYKISFLCFCSSICWRNSSQYFSLAFNFCSSSYLGRRVISVPPLRTDGAASGRCTIKSAKSLSFFISYLS